MKKIEYELFKEGLKEKDLVKIRKVSKGDVHNHCGLGMRFSTFNKWAGGNVNKPPKKIDGLKGLDNYIFNETMKYISKRGCSIFNRRNCQGSYRGWSKIARDKYRLS